ncbi:iron-sulfur cluster biosynthesis family protein [Lacticaseibacillus sp. GG6-2]
MKITIKPEALTYLQAKMAPEDRVFLALDDGSSKYSQLGGTCAIGNKYQLVLTDAEDSDYAIKVDNDAGVPLTTGDLELMYLGNGLVLDYQQATLVLRDDSGILDGAVMVNRPTPLTAEVQQAIGDKIC